MAWRTFLERPLLGVGAGNFGIFAFENLWADPELRLYYHRGLLWGRAVHNVYFQLLSEFGLLGTLAFVSLLVDFWRRNARLRSAAFISAWKSASENPLDLRMLSHALEVGMVAYLATGFFYDQVYVHWFYSLLTLNAVVHLNAARLALEQSQRPKP